ncbi:MAG TPA: MurR/RpiR family transcriptional regulator [Firmicutes bacterium]|jgi:RpiR family carbohydrate utilization transcriptional regulator|nr:MurR/RpiR family transcriptional regulator [Bacillota bacterium]
MLNGHGGVFLRINGVYPHLGRMEQRVANFIKNYPEEVVRLPINVLADKVGVSSSTIVRLCRRLGIQGYSDLKLQLAQDLAASTRHAYADEGDASGPEALIRATHERLLDSINDTFRFINAADLVKAGNYLQGARTILVIGTGGSAAVASLFNYNLIKLGFPSQASTDFVAIPLILNRMGPQDVLVAISHSGSTSSVDEAVGMAKSQGCRVVGLTNYPESVIARQSDVVLTTAVIESPHGSEGGPIRVAQIAVLDALWQWLSAASQREEVGAAASRG